MLRQRFGAVVRASSSSWKASSSSLRGGLEEAREKSGLVMKRLRQRREERGRYRHYHHRTAQPRQQRQQQRQQPLLRSRRRRDHDIPPPRNGIGAMTTSATTSALSRRGIAPSLPVNNPHGLHVWFGQVAPATSAFDHLSFHTSAATAVTAAAPTTMTRARRHRHRSDPDVWRNGSLLFLGAAAAASVVRATRCERDVDDDDDDGGGEEPDPYDNLPEEDEETNCSMCKTFRQGPCRPYWRKLEHCFKDNEDDDGGDNDGGGKSVTNCMRYFRPHQECLMKYTNLYDLVSLQMKQELVDEAELSVLDHERGALTDVGLDWSKWNQFQNDLRGLGGGDHKNGDGGDGEEGDDRIAIAAAAASAMTQTVPNLPKNTPLWKRLPDNTEPVLVPVTVIVPKLRHPDRGDDDDDAGSTTAAAAADAPSPLIVKMAYAVDQDGMALGMSYNQEYGDMLRKVHEEEFNRGSSGGEAKDKGDGDSSGGENDGKEKGKKKKGKKTTKKKRTKKKRKKSIKAADNEGKVAEGKTKEGEMEIPDPSLAEHQGEVLSSSSTSASSGTGASEYFEFRFFVMPGETREVRVAALYAENPVEADPKKTILDARLCKTDAMDLSKVK